MKKIRCVLVILLTFWFTNAIAQDEPLYIFNKQPYFVDCAEFLGSLCGFSTIIDIPSRDKRFNFDTYYFGFDNVTYFTLLESGLEKVSPKDFEQEVSIDTINLSYIKNFKSIDPYELHEKLSLTKKIYLVTKKNRKYVCYRILYKGTAKKVAPLALDSKH